MSKNEIEKHVKGESLFVDDFTLPDRTWFASILDSPIAHGKIKHINIPADVRAFTYRDIPGENQIGNIIQDEHLLAEEEVNYIGEPIAIVVAETQEKAEADKRRIEFEFEEHEAVTEPREAFRRGMLIAPPVIFSIGNTEEAFNQCDYVIEDKVEIGGQEHLYLETQASIAIPGEDESVKIYSSTQSPTAVQRATAKVLGVAMNKVEVDVLRLGGGFGGKEDQATPWAAMCALAASLLNKPVKLRLSRQEDLRMTGKRHPYSADYKIGLTKEGKILAYEATFYQNAGACADLSTAILERTMFHATNSYFIPNVKTTGISCKTNLPPNTAFRGFGGPQAMFVIESAIFKAARQMNVEPYEIQRKNLLKEGDYFYYGQKVERCKVGKCWEGLEKNFVVSKKIEEIKKFNDSNKLFKKGFAFIPITFGISFTSKFLNQASALIHIYTDSAVGVITTAVEMGQEVNEKIRNIVAKALGISLNKIKMETTNTTRAANTSPTAASSAADLNGNAALIAANELKKRLTETAGRILKTPGENIAIYKDKVWVGEKSSGINWEELVNRAYLMRVSLTEQAFYATPDIHFNRSVNKGRPFAYHVFGAAFVVSKIDVLRGVYEIEEVNVVHDYGESLNITIDKGQTEGGIVQGIGWLTLEELAQNEEGKLLSNSLSTYKIPDIYFTPKINIHFLEGSKNPYGPFKSKAIGEPPFMYGIGAYFSLLSAIKAYVGNIDFKIHSPLTPERALSLLSKKKLVKA